MGTHTNETLRVVAVAGEEWDWSEAAFNLVGGTLIIAGNYGYFEFRAIAAAEAAAAAA